MKFVIATLAALSFTTPALASSLSESILCHAEGDKSAAGLTVYISSYNFPDFDLGKFDSKVDDDRVQTNFYQGKKQVQAQLSTYTVIDGKSTPIMDRDSHGKACALGSKIKGIQVAAKLTVGKKQKLVILTCDDEVLAPHGGDCQ